MRYDLFVSDFDGTLGQKPNDGSKNYIEKETIEAVKEYEKRGGKFVICTGRSYSSIKSICKLYNITGLVSAFQGQSIRDLKDDKIIFKTGISSENAFIVAEKLKKDNVKTVAWINDELYYDQTSVYSEMFKNDDGVNCIQVDNVASLIKKLNTVVDKICGVIENGVTETDVNKYNIFTDYDITCNSGAKCLLEFVNLNYNKGFALKYIAKLYNIPLSKTLAVGDSSNDIGLMGKDWHGVAVGNGSEMLKNAADEVTVEFAKKPVKYLLDKYCLKI